MLLGHYGWRGQSGSQDSGCFFSYHLHHPKDGSLSQEEAPGTEVGGKGEERATAAESWPHMGGRLEANMQGTV